MSRPSTLLRCGHPGVIVCHNYQIIGFHFWLDENATQGRKHPVDIRKHRDVSHHAPNLPDPTPAAKTARKQTHYSDGWSYRVILGS